MGKNRDKGHNAERQYAEEFRQMGYDKCITSRYGSRAHDDAGVDLLYTHPFNVQIKAGYARGINYTKVLKEMSAGVQDIFPHGVDEHHQTNIIIHKKDVGSGKRRTKYDELVVLSWEDFKKLLQ